MCNADVSFVFASGTTSEQVKPFPSHDLICFAMALSDAPFGRQIKTAFSPRGVTSSSTAICQAGCMQHLYKTTDMVWQRLFGRLLQTWPFRSAWRLVRNSGFQAAQPRDIFFHLREETTRFCKRTKHKDTERTKSIQNVCSVGGSHLFGNPCSVVQTYGGRDILQRCFLMGGVPHRLLFLAKRSQNSNSINDTQK